VEHLRKTLSDLQQALKHDTSIKIAEVEESHEKTSEQVQILKDLLSKVSERTSEFANKFPELEGHLLKH
jgi:Skp family chaperone for outer membrane proteins